MASDEFRSDPYLPNRPSLGRIHRLHDRLTKQLTESGDCIVDTRQAQAVPQGCQR